MKELPAFVLTRKSTPTTFHFRDPSGHGWGALCTVNDATGELSIMSDWGSWAYLWSADPKHLGAPTLTHFIGDRNAVDYLAQKLLVSHGGGEQFDAEDTTRHFQRELATARLEHGRVGVDSQYPPAWAWITAGLAREMWESLDSLTEVGDGEQASALYLEQFYRDDNLVRLFNEPWEELQHSETTQSKVLRGRILPALIEACREHVRPAPTAGAAAP